MSGETFMFAEPIEIGYDDAASVDVIFETLGKISREAQSRLSENFHKFLDLISDAALQLHLLIRSHDMNLFDINDRLRRSNYLIWPFLEEITHEHPHKCLSIVGDQPCKYAIYIFIGGERAFIYKELLPRNRTMQEHLSLLKTEVPGYLSPK